jgi:hypothetical protein
MKTAVEWLVEQLPLIQQEGLRDIIEQAKEIEKEYIINAHYQGYRPSIGTTEISEHYYNKTFKSE